MTAELNQDLLRSILDYNPDTGVFTWKVNRPRVRAGDEAGCEVRYRNTLYRKIRIWGKNYMVHRLAFLWMTGVWPPEEVDHKDRNTLNNVWANLRHASKSENQRNRSVRVDSSTGVKGVRKQKSAHGSKAEYYVATIRAGGERLYLGSFKTARGAGTAYKNAAKAYHKDFARTEKG